ncbi:MAG: sugar ABC transporter permease [Anaerolineales bacterium]|nr:sugar ABC transporter permease [Anaerolineales bacterium]
MGKFQKALGRFMRINRIAYSFIAPAVIVMFLVHLIPTAQALYMSLLNVTQSTYAAPFSSPFVGLHHYQRILGGLLFGSEDKLITDLTQSVINSFWFTLWVQLGTLAISLILALLLNREFFARGLARTLVLLPWVIPTFAVGVIWRFIWAQEGGLANRIIVDWLHLADDPLRWLIGANARTALILPAIWRGLPFTTVMLLAAMQIIPDDIYEAAAIDGANDIQKFLYITWHYLVPIIAVTTLFGIVFNFFGFGPYNIAITLFGTDQLGRYVDLIMVAIARQSFGYQLYGYGAAASVIIMIAALVFTGLYYRTFKEGLTSE